RHVRQLELEFLGGRAGLAPLRDVLRTGTRRLHHLVMGPAAAVDVGVTKADSQVVHQLCQLEGLEIAVTAMFGNYGAVSAMRRGVRVHAVILCKSHAGLAPVSISSSRGRVDAGFHSSPCSNRPVVKNRTTCFAASSFHRMRVCVAGTVTKSRIPWSFVRFTATFPS